MRRFVDDFGPERLYAISGKPVDVISCVYRLKHWRYHKPALLDTTRTSASVHNWPALHLMGHSFGLFDIGAKG